MSASSSSTEAGGPLACPRCALSYPLEERFCANCGMPLVYKGRRDEEPITDAQQKARKVRPEYTRGEPVKVAFARNQAEAELIQGMLLEEGIPSTQRRARGFDVPDFLAAGPREILVPVTGAHPARELLEGTQILTEDEERAQPAERSALRAGAGRTPEAQLAFWVIAGVAVAFAIVWLLYRLAV